PAPPAAPPTMSWAPMAAAAVLVVVGVVAGAWIAGLHRDRAPEDRLRRDGVAQTPMVIMVQRPGPQPTPVVAAQTAPPPTPQPTPAVTQSADAAGDRSPKELVEAFYAYQNRGDWSDAYALLSSRYQAQEESLDKFVAERRGTTAFTSEVTSVAGNRVYLTVRWAKVNSSMTLAGYWDLIRENGHWKLDDWSFRSVQ
ncbi:MAG TPA: hypothetical protein VK669_12465, partial [Candidatus Limnocylindrales bacterium]|nr:hypothetical protein [Candidatus Limnocylindrales bacterium]